MARKILVETHYTFTPSTKTLVIPKAIPRERLLLITNVTQNQVIYNFSDPSLNATSYVSLEANGVETTTIVFAYNTAAMLSTDKISITLDEVDESFTPSETMLDPTNKLRVTHMYDNKTEEIRNEFENEMMSQIMVSLSLSKILMDSK